MKYMYKYLLVAINAKYIHSNLGIYSIEAYIKKNNPRIHIERLESTINHNLDKILQAVYERKADAVGFSSYIWNIEYVLLLTKNLKKIAPHIKIILGGPEVSYKAEHILQEYPEVDIIIRGEGEQTSLEVIGALEEHRAIGDIAGITYRDEKGIHTNQDRAAMDMDELEFVYPYLEPEIIENRIVYYESSRGCPFRCSYCLSSIGSDLKFRTTDKVLKEIGYFLDNKVPQVKFVDRTFNAKRSHTLAILKYLKEHDNGITNFHFEIEGAIMSEEEIEAFGSLRKGQVQLEVGVQSTNVKTLREVRRFSDIPKLARIVARLREKQNIHLHLDLIAGLPYEDLSSFVNSFNEVYAMGPDELQLGFLKVLDGSHMSIMEKEYGIVRFDTPPYEILSNRWLSYRDILLLKGVEEVLEVYYNSHQFEESMAYLEERFASPFALYQGLATFYEEYHLFDNKQNRIRRYEILFDFVRRTRIPDCSLEAFQDVLMIDLYKREKAKSRPNFGMEDRSMEKEYKEIFKMQCMKRGLKNHEAHLEVLQNGALVFFDYTKRNPISYNVEYEILG